MNEVMTFEELELKHELDEACRQLKKAVQNKEAVKKFLNRNKESPKWREAQLAIYKKQAIR